MAKTILEEAMEDAKLLKETAFENAKNVLVEAISPQIKEFVDGQLGEIEFAEASDVGDDEEELDMTETAGMEGMYETELALEAKDEDEDEDKEDLDEVVEITQEDLKKAFSEVVQLDLAEAQVTKGFGDAEDPNVPEGPGATGIADEKSGEAQWTDEEAPDSEDWTVKEAFYRKKIKQLARKCAGIKNENKQYKQVCSYLKRNLQEVNLFNNKLLYTSKLIQNTNLNNKQQLAIIESFDSAQTQREVELVYKSISESLKITGVLSEVKKGKRSSKISKSSRYTTPSSTMLQESMKADSGEDVFAARMQKLSGIID